MDANRKTLCAVYGVIAAGALIGTWWQNLAFMALPGSTPLAFIKATLANPAAASFSIDLTFLCAAAWIWMAVEGRRLGIRFVWAYIALSVLIAVSVMFPLFLIAREVRIAADKAIGVKADPPFATHD